MKFIEGEKKERTSKYKILKKMCFLNKPDLLKVVDPGMLLVFVLIFLVEFGLEQLHGLLRGYYKNTSLEM